MQVHLVKKSSNKKLGGIPSSYTEQKSCPVDCTMREVCYAKTGYHTRLNWDKVSNHERGTDWHTFCESIAQLKPNTLWRHNVAGDLPHLFGDIDTELLTELVNANVGKQGYTYTHHKLNNHNHGALLLSNSMGFTVNKSCENLSDADDAIRRGIPAVCVIASDKEAPKVSPKGTKTVVCPAQTSDATCSTCGLCSKANRNCIVLFLAHGNKKKLANTIVS